MSHADPGRIVHLLTGRDMPKPDPESHLLVEALADRGVGARLLPWDHPDAGRHAALMVVRTTWDYPARRDEFVAWCAAAGERVDVLNPPGVIAWNSSKGYLVELEAAGVPVVPTTVRAPGQPLDAPVGAFVIKPAVSSGADGAARFDRPGPEAEAHLAGVHGQGGDAVVQPYLPEVAEQGERSLVFLGGELSHAVNKRPAAGDYRVQERWGGRVSSHRPTRAEVDAARRALAAVAEPLLYARVDLVPSERGPLVMELELIEPELFLALEPRSAGRMADQVVRHLDRPRVHGA